MLRTCFYLKGLDPNVSSMSRIPMPLSLFPARRAIRYRPVPAIVKCSVLSLALIGLCAIFAAVSSYIHTEPVDFIAPIYPIVAEVSLCKADSANLRIPSTPRLYSAPKYYSWMLVPEHLWLTGMLGWHPALRP